MAIDKTSDQFLLDAYSGKGGFATGEYLIAHPRESSAKLTQRKELATYPNYVRKIVDVYMGFLWRQPPQREIDKLYVSFANNADGAGTKLNQFLFIAQRLALIMGTVFIIIDKSSKKAATRAEETLPYAVLRLKSQLVSEEKDSNGLWTSVTFSETAPDGKPQYRTFTPAGWKICSDAKGEKDVISGQHSLGRVPVAALHVAYPLNPTDSVSESWVYDLAALNHDLYNLCSELRELFRAQTFAILTLPVASAEERERLKDLTIGTENALPYNPQGGGQPGFIAPPSDPVELYMRRIESVVDDIYRVANLEFMSGGGSGESGVTMAFRFMNTNRNLMGMAEMAEQAEQQIAGLVYAWQGRTFDGNIAYAADFNMADLSQAIAIASDSVTLGMGPEFDKAVKKRLAKQILGNDVSSKTMSAIDAEIDAAGDVFGDRMAQQAGVN